MSYDFKSLVVSGCGSKCIGFLGCLFQLSADNVINLDNIDTYIGVSSGSMLSMMLIIGYKPEEILRLIKKDNIFQILYNSKNFSNIFNGKGIFDYTIIDEYIQKLTFEKTGKHVITFKDIRETFNKRLVICSYNETQHKAVYFDSANTKYDNITCNVAIRCSSNLPYIFSDFFMDNCEYIDGGVCDILPIHIADNKSHDVIALVTNLYSESRFTNDKNNSILKKLINRIQIPIWQLLQRRIDNASPKVKIININLDAFPIYEFNISSTDVMDMFNIGMQEAINSPISWKQNRLKQD